MQLNQGNMNIYIFACMQINMYIEWNSEDSIFIVNVEQYLLRSRQKRPSRTCFYCLFFLYISFGEEEKKMIFIVNSALILGQMALEIFFISSVVNILLLIHYYLPLVSMGI